MNLGVTVHINRGVLFGIIVFFVVVIVLYRNGNSEINISSQYIKNVNSVNLKELLVASISAATRGGTKVYEARISKNLNEKSKGKTKEGVNDPVTDGDKLSHLEMFHSIQNAFASIHIISEEKSTHSLLGSQVLPAAIKSVEIDSMKLPDEYVDYKDVLVWIDPLDATKEYTENLLQYVTTMVCVAVRGRPVIGVIHKPFSNTTVWAWVDHMFSNNSTFKVSKRNEISSEVKIIVSRSHKGEVEKVSKKAFGEKASITGAAGAGYKTLELINGNEDVYVHTSLIKKWDICSGNAILEHFHGKMTTLDGREIDYSSAKEVENPNGLVASLFNHKYYLENLAAIHS